MNIEIDRHQFAAWLSSMGRKKVGLQMDSEDEPLNNWLRTKYPYTNFINDGECIQVRPRNGEDFSVDLPLWARVFSADFDRYGSHEGEKHIAASRCLSILTDGMKAIAEAKLKPDSTTDIFPLQDVLHGKDNHA